MNEAIEEDRYFPLSAISHYSFCPRRCALVHLECAWSENYFTASGKNLHAKVDGGCCESRNDLRIARGLRLFSKEIGICGIADVVEFHRDDVNGVAVLGWQGRWRPYPIEYKLGTAKNEVPYERQLCAQAICLEGLFHVRINEGALYLGIKKHRRRVFLDEKLREDTWSVCVAIRRMLENGAIPVGQYGPHCKSCSLIEHCMPKLFHCSAKDWLMRELKAASHRTM